MLLEDLKNLNRVLNWMSPTVRMSQHPLDLLGLLSSTLHNLKMKNLRQAHLFLI